MRRVHTVSHQLRHLSSVTETHVKALEKRHRLNRREKTLTGSPHRQFAHAGGQFFRQDPSEQSVFPLEHPQTPSSQICPVGHRFPHRPQLDLSLHTSRHCPSQSIRVCQSRRVSPPRLPARPPRPPPHTAPPRPPPEVGARGPHVKQGPEWLRAGAQQSWP